MQFFFFFLLLDGEKLRENPYNSQVWVKSNSQSPNTPSEGKLQIYLNKEWGSFCYEGFNQLAADTVCLQKGFTNAVHLGHQSDSKWDISHATTDD